MYRFMIPVSIDRFGLVTHKECVVQRELIPFFAEIIEAATRPFTVRQQYELHYAVFSDFAKETQAHIRRRVRYDLEHALREEAKKNGHCIITPVTFEEKADEPSWLFTASAVAMRLLELPEGFAL